MSPLGIGTWAWGERLWGYGREYGDAELQAAFGAALRAGINFFDTAEVYGLGRSERLLGRFLAQSSAAAGSAGGAIRQALPPVVATKFMPFPWRLRRKSLIGALEASLERLGLERVDVYQVHWPFPPVPIETWMNAMADAVRAGLVRAVGVSNYNEAQMRRAHEALLERGLRLASNQVEFSLLNRRAERRGLLAACRQLGITLIAYSPLGQGLLTGKYSTRRPPPGFRRRRFGARLLEQMEPLVGLLREIGQGRGGKSPAQVALNWAICKGAVPIPGAKNAQQVEEAAGALGWRLTPDEVAALDAAADRVRC